MATKPLISRNTRFSKFREHVRRWAFQRTKDDAQDRHAWRGQGRSDGGMKKFVADRAFAARSPTTTSSYRGRLDWIPTG